MVRPFCAGDDAHMHRLLARQLPEQRARSRNLVGPNSTQRRAESCPFRRSSLTVRACVRACVCVRACARARVRACGSGGVVAVAAASTERGACKGTSSSRPRTCRRYPNQASNHRPSLAAASRQLLQRPFQPQTGALRGGSTLGATQVGHPTWPIWHDRAGPFLFWPVALDSGRAVPADRSGRTILTDVLVLRT